MYDSKTNVMQNVDSIKIKTSLIFYQLFHLKGKRVAGTSYKLGLLVAKTNQAIEKRLKSPKSNRIGNEKFYEPRKNKKPN